MSEERVEISDVLATTAGLNDGLERRIKSPLGMRAGPEARRGIHLVDAQTGEPNWAGKVLLRMYWEMREVIEAWRSESEPGNREKPGRNGGDDDPLQVVLNRRVWSTGDLVCEEGPVHVSELELGQLNVVFGNLENMKLIKDKRLKRRDPRQMVLTEAGVARVEQEFGEWLKEQLVTGH